MSGCEGCGETDKDLYEGRLQIIEQAKKYALANTVNVAIYPLPGNRFGFIREDIARRDGFPIIRLISHLQPNTDG